MNSAVNNTMMAMPMDSEGSYEVNTTFYPECGSKIRTSSSQNVHFHGIHGLPRCHEDEVVSTLVNYQQTFTYDIQIPLNQNPGMYWYHPHVHGSSEVALQGGATGVIIVNGIEAIKPQVVGLYQQILVLRDIVLPTSSISNSSLLPTGETEPTYDINLNYHPIPFPTYPPVIVEMLPGESQFWRILNSCSDAQLVLQLWYDDTPQIFEIISIDGTAISDDNPNRFVNQYYLASGNRLEIIVTGPSSSVSSAQLITLDAPTGPFGDADPMRPLVSIIPKPDAYRPAIQIQSGTALALTTDSMTKSVSAVRALHPAASRILVFSEIQPTTFYITVKEDEPRIYSRNNAPAIVATQGTVEDWTIENASNETHVFHIHQIHFLVMAINGVSLPPSEMYFADVLEVPYLNNVTLRMDFTENDIQGKFVYHCHILGHEDLGMMAVLQINPASEGPLPPPSEAFVSSTVPPSMGHSNSTQNGLSGGAFYDTLLGNFKDPYFISTIILGGFIILAGCVLFIRYLIHAYTTPVGGPAGKNAVADRFSGWSISMADAAITGGAIDVNKADTNSGSDLGRLQFQQLYGRPQPLQYVRSQSPASGSRSNTSGSGHGIGTNDSATSPINSAPDLSWLHGNNASAPPPPNAVISPSESRITSDDGPVTTALPV